jgi:flagellar basal-body rod protein FlgF
MDNTLYVSLSRQMALQHELDVIANNVANVDTAGFKVESLTMQEQPEALPADGSGPSLVKFVLDSGVVRDFGQGALKETGGPLNLAIDGEGFFRITTAAGERYSRDGRFTMDAQGRIVTASGDPVQGDGGDIVLDPTRGEPKIAQDGTVSQRGQIVARISLVNFANLSALSKAGNGYYANVSNLQPQAAAAARIRQGMLESSNVEPITQMTRLIEVTRAYENISKMIQNTADLSSKSIDKLGRLN